MLTPRLLLLAIIPALAACGAERTPSVGSAAKTTLAAGSARTSFTGTSTGPGSPLITMSGSGDFQVAPQVGQANIQFSSPASSGTIRELQRGTFVYMVSPLFRGSIPGGKAWVKVDLKTRPARGGGFDPQSVSVATARQTLELLRTASHGKKVGTETIAGVRTTRLRARVKAPGNSGGAAVVFAPVDVWVDRSGRVRRVLLSFSRGSSKTRMTTTFSRYGEAVHVDLPDPSVVYVAKPNTPIG